MQLAVIHGDKSRLQSELVVENLLFLDFIPLTVHHKPYMNHTSFIFNISHVGFNGFFFFFGLLTSWPHFWSAFGIGAELHSLFECRTENNIFYPILGKEEVKVKVESQVETLN